MISRKRYVIVGTGGRCSMFVRAILQKYPHVAELVGLCDISPTSSRFWNDEIVNELGGQPMPAVGIAGNQSIRTGRPVRIDELLPLLDASERC